MPQCTATSKASRERCRRHAIRGGTVCINHGGQAPQVKASAKRRLLEAADPAAAYLAKLVEDAEADPSVRVKAAQLILDRAGHGPGQTVTLEGEVSLGERIRRGRARAKGDT